MSGTQMLVITGNTLYKLLAALNECTEWGQVRVAALLLLLVLLLIKHHFPALLDLSSRPQLLAVDALCCVAWPLAADSTAGCPCVHMTHKYTLFQVFILDALVNYKVTDGKDAEKIVERVLPRLQHVNSAVVLSAAKVRSAAHTPSANTFVLRSW